jgi:two-component system, chemotaxis family, chemotaxis protein CheY
MKALIVDDDFSCRKILQMILSRHGDCDVAVDGEEAIKAFRAAAEEGEPYNLICLDIMMPGMDGHQVLRAIRQIEADSGVHGLDGVRVVMTTALDDYENVRRSFEEQCEGYLTKPIRREKLVELLRALELLEVNP